MPAATRRSKSRPVSARRAAPARRPTPVRRARPSGRADRTAVEAVRALPRTATALGVPVGTSGPVPAEIGLPREALTEAGFDGAIGQTLTLPRSGGSAVIAVGIGDAKALDAAGLRNAAAAFARAAGRHGDIATTLGDIASVRPEAAGQAIVEGALLARYRFDAFKPARASAPALARLSLVTGAGRSAGVAKGADRGQVTAGAAMLARDLANTPHNHLTATRMAEIANTVGKAAGLRVEVFDKPALQKMGCGGLLGVNAGSAEPPRMIKLTYAPKSRNERRSGRLALVGKGIMYDAGGIAIKPGDEVHAQMKNDMSGAGAILAAMSALGALGCTNTVTGWLMCTDNMPSGTAMALGDVITIRGGKTVEVINTDAEGRLVMADALVLATEEPNDAIVDIATLTGACMRALGTQVAGVIGNNQRIIDQVRAAGGATDEPVWQLPLERRYRRELDSPVADMRNLGGANAGAITAALFLEEFVGGLPWAHIDIAGTAQSAGDAGWHTAGCTGFGARLLIELALNFTPSRR